MDNDDNNDDEFFTLGRWFQARNRVLGWEEQSFIAEEPHNMRPDGGNSHQTDLPDRHKNDHSYRVPQGLLISSQCSNTRKLKSQFIKSACFSFLHVGSTLEQLLLSCIFYHTVSSFC